MKKHTGDERFDDDDVMKEEVNNWLKERARQPSVWYATATTKMN